MPMAARKGQMELQLEHPTPAAIAPRKPSNAAYIGQEEVTIPTIAAGCFTFFSDLAIVCSIMIRILSMAVGQPTGYKVWDWDQTTWRWSCDCYATNTTLIRDESSKG